MYFNKLSVHWHHEKDNSSTDGTDSCLRMPQLSLCPCRTFCQELFVEFPFIDCYIPSHCFLLLSLPFHVSFHLVENHEGSLSSPSLTVSPFHFWSVLSSLTDDFCDINIWRRSYSDSVSHARRHPLPWVWTDPVQGSSEAALLLALSSSQIWITSRAFETFYRWLLLTCGF